MLIELKDPKVRDLIEAAIKLQQPVWVAPCLANAEIHRRHPVFLRHDRANLYTNANLIMWQFSEPAVSDTIALAYGENSPAVAYGIMDPTCRMAALDSLGILPGRFHITADLL